MKRGLNVDVVRSGGLWKGKDLREREEETEGGVREDGATTED
jgi:hypothetical protein